MQASKEKRIIVTHSGRQYVHQLLLVLQRNFYLKMFFTSFWYKPKSLPFNLINFLPGKIQDKIKKQLRKRYFEGINSNLIYQFPVFEILREITDRFFSVKNRERMLFLRDRIHDNRVARNIKKGECDIVIGYEECSLNSFKRAKRLRIVTILDLAQVHYKEITSISNQYPSFGEIYGNKDLRNKINKIKQEELENSDYIFCLSNFAKSTLIKNGINESNIFVLNLGFDPFLFKPKIDYKIKGKLKLIFVGTMTKRKGLDLLLKLVKENKDLLELTLIGPLADGGNLLDEYKGFYNWIPYLEQKEMNTVLSNSDLFVFPSYLDSWAMVVIEAMACGLPVIVTENTGAKDAVDNSCGFVISPGNYVELFDKVFYFEKNRGELERMGKNAREKSLKFTWENYYLQVENALSKIKID